MRKWLITAGYLIILFGTGLKSYSIKGSKSTIGIVSSINCNRFHPGLKGIYISVNNELYRLSQDCSVFEMHHPIGEEIEVLINTEQKRAYLPTTKSTHIPFVFFLSISPIVFYYAFKK
jgi:hypothetical protein